MSGPDLEFRSDPETVCRVGFEPDPWAWTPWHYATDSGLFAGRWDDQKGNFRTLYTCDSLLGCFLELLAKLRLDTVLENDLDAIDDPDGEARLFPDASGVIGYDWVAGRRYGKAEQTGRYCLITNSRSVATVAAAHVLDPLGIPARDIDVALLKDARQRTVTRTVASWLYDLRDENRLPLFDVWLSTPATATTCACGPSSNARLPRPATSTVTTSASGNITRSPLNCPTSPKRCAATALVGPCRRWCG